MAKLSPVFNDQTIDENGDPYVGAQLFTYIAGSSTKQPVYTDESGTIPHSNPIIINSLGFPAQGAIRIPEGVSVKFVLASPTDTDPPTSPLKTIDNVEGVNDAGSSVSEWQASGIAPTYIGTTSFSLPGDQTTDFHVGRRLQFTVGLGTVYGTIITSAYTSLTTVTMLMDAGQELDSGLSAVNVSILRADNLSEPFTNTSETIGGVKTFTSSPVVPADFKWQCYGIGSIYEVDDTKPGVEVPPTSSSLYRYIKLTAADAYNSGCLTSESVTGTAPTVTATATISLAGSPMLGASIYLENTMRAFSRAGNSGVLEAGQTKNHTHGTAATFSSVAGTDFAYTAGAGNRAYALATQNVIGGPSGADDETRPRNIGKTRYMRIK